MSGAVLLVEDDLPLGTQVQAYLRDAGFETEWWREGRRWPPGCCVPYALVILDLMLPEVYGLDLLKDLRACSEVPVLVLSARNSAHDRVRALQLGADDYLTKPFWPEELIERARARLRRPTLRRTGSLRVGPLTIEPELHRATLEGRLLELTRVEFEILLALARRPEAAISRHWFAENVLDPTRDASERSVDAHVSRLRKKLGADRLIETVWGIGYRLSVEPP